MLERIVITLCVDARSAKIQCFACARNMLFCRIISFSRDKYKEKEAQKNAGHTTKNIRVRTATLYHFICKENYYSTFMRCEVMFHVYTFSICTLWDPSYNLRSVFNHKK